MGKKILSVVLTVCMMLSVPLPQTAKAGEADTRASASALLASASFGDNVELTSGFDKSCLEYVGVASGSDAVLTLAAEDDQANIKMFLNNEKVGEGTGNVTASGLTLRSDGNALIYACVTASDNSASAVYEFNLANRDGEKTTVYLSDHPELATSVSNGDGELKWNQNRNGQKITLKNGSGSNQEFEKGFGAHAPCTIVYDLSGGIYENFSTYVGIDQQSVTKPEEPDVTFAVYGDGDQKLHETGKMVSTTPMEKIEVSVAGQKTLKLTATEGEHNWSDHADFADAKLEALKFDTYSVRYQAAAGGAVTASIDDTAVNGAAGAVAVKDGQTLKLTATAESGYEFADWCDADGKSVGTESELSISDISANASYRARFTSASTAPVTISASDYQPDAAHDNDWAVAIQQMIEDARLYKNSEMITLDFPKDTYNIYPDRAFHRELYISNTVGANQSYKDKNIGFLFEDMENVTIEGNGSLFLFHGNMTTFATIDSTNINFHNYEFDFADPSVVDITVESIEGNSAIVYVPEYYNYTVSGTNVNWSSSVSPYTGRTYWTASNALGNIANQIFDASTGLTFREGTQLFNNLSGIEDLGNRKLKFTYNGNGMHSTIQTGRTYEMRNTTRDHAGMFFWKSKDVTLQDVDVHFLYGFGIVGQHSENITFDGVKFETPEGSGRKTVGFADFLQMSGCKGKITVQNCSFSNPHDDPINIHGTFNKVVEKISSRKFKVRYMHHETAGFPNYFVGDEVEFMTAGDMIPVANSVAKVVAVEGPTGNSGASSSGTNSLTDIIITLDRDVPDAIAVNTHVVENITYTPEVLIRDNIFKETPTRGILVTTRRKVEILNNKFDGMGMASIYISNDAQGWWESGPVKDVLIEGNTFYRPTTSAAAIFIEPTNPTVATDATVHKNIRINDNVFYMQNGQVLNAKSVDGLSFTNNKIYRYEPASGSFNMPSDTWRQGARIPLVTDCAWSSHSSGLYSFNGCANINLNGNVYDGGLNLRANISNGSASDLTIGDNEGVQIGADNKLAPESGEAAVVRYESSDSSVVKINEDGTSAVGQKPGTAVVTAYLKIGDRDETCLGAASLTITAPIDAERNAYLSQASFGDSVKLDSPFYFGQTEYNGYAPKNTSSVSLALETEEQSASISVFANNQKIAESTGSVDVSSLSVDGDGNTKIYVCVTSPNGKASQVYEFDIDTSRTYLSDLTRNSDSTNGYGSIHDDLTIDGNPLTLMDANGTKRVFAKGIGAHATCNLIYDLPADAGYTDMSVYVGIDANEGSGDSSAAFRIFGDDEKLAETAEMLHGTPMELLLVPVEGVNTLRLYADKGEADYVDHVDFADAKLLKIKMFTVRYQSSSAARGTVSSNLAEAAEGIAAVGRAGTLTLTAEPKRGCEFDGWYDGQGTKVSGEATWTLTNVRANASYVAKFVATNPVFHTISYSASPADAADVSAQSEDNVTSNGSIEVEEGQEVTLKAEPKAGYVIDGWYNAQDEKVSSNAEFWIENVTEDASYTAKMVLSEEQAVEEAKKDLQNVISSTENSKKDDDALAGYDEEFSAAYKDVIAAAIQKAEALIGSGAATEEEVRAAIAEVNQKAAAANRILEEGPTLQNEIDNVELKGEDELAAYPSSLQSAYAAASQAAVSSLRAVLQSMLAGELGADVSANEAVLTMKAALADAEQLLEKGKELQTAISDRQKRNFSAYTEASVKLYKAKLSDLEKILAKQNVSLAELVQALADLDSAEKLLVKETGIDKSKLNAAIEAAKRALQAQAKYTPDTVAKLSEALSQAEKVSKTANATQTAVNNAVKALQDAQNGLKEIPKVKSTFDDKGLRYKVTKSDAKNGAVTVTKVVGKQKASVSIPDTVVKDGCVFKVTAIDKGAFQKNKKLSKVTIGKNVTSIGANAFNKCSKLKKITFKGTKAPKIGAKAFKGIKSNCTVATPKMKKAQINTLKKNLKKRGVSGKAKYTKK